MPYPYSNPYYPNAYQPYQMPQYQPYQPQVTQPVMAQQAAPAQATPQNVSTPPLNQVQSGGFVTVRSEDEARAYPVAPGMSITFKHENAPYCYTKTMGFSQFESPRFEKFKLVKEEDEGQGAPIDGGNTPAHDYATIDEVKQVAVAVKALDEAIGAMKTEISNMQSDLYGLSGRKKPAKKQETETEE